ncbi:MAG: serine hydrolase domain-containing protein [Chloroflexota bacterium]
MQTRLQNFTRQLLTFSLFFVLLSTQALASPSQAGADFEAVDAYLRAEIDELRIPGLEMAVVYKDEVLHLGGFGAADAAGSAVTPQTPMVIGSVSKGFTALAVMQLAEAGKIDLEAPIQEYLPWFSLSDSKGDIPAGAWKQIHIRQLLNQTSGISEYTGANSWSSREAGDDALENTVRAFDNFPLVHAPGEAFEYSNANYQVLGLIVQAVSGQSYEAYIQEHIFDPLEMHHSYALAGQAPELASGYRFWFGQPFPAPGLPYPRAHAPSAMLASCAEDMGHYLIAQMNGGKYGDVRILSEQGMAELHSPAADFGNDNRYAMGWVVTPEGALFHNGETPGFTSGIRIDGDWGVFVVRNIAANQREQRLDEIAPGAISILQGQPPARNNLDPSFRRTMVILGVLLGLQLAGLFWAVRRWQRWARQPGAAPQTTLRTLLAVIPAGAASLALAGLLWYMGPVSSHRSFSVQALSAPDQMLLLGLNLGLAIAGVAVQVARALWSLRKMV